MKHWLLSVAALALPFATPVEARQPAPKGPGTGMVIAAEPTDAASGSNSRAGV